MSQRTKLSKSKVKATVGLQKNKLWKQTCPQLMIEVPHYSRAGIMYTKRIPFYKVQKKQQTPIIDMVDYLGSFFGRLFR